MCFVMKLNLQTLIRIHLLKFKFRNIQNPSKTHFILSIHTFLLRFFIHSVDSTINKRIMKYETNVLTFCFSSLDWSLVNPNSFIFFIFFLFWTGRGGAFYLKHSRWSSFNSNENLKHIFVRLFEQKSTAESFGMHFSDNLLLLF